MGAGRALEFLRRFPYEDDKYLAMCRRKELTLGKPCLLKRKCPPWILYFPTKDDWRHQSKIEDIALGVAYLGQHYKVWGIQSLAVPALGCGLGRLVWSEVAPIFVAQFEKFTIPVWLFASM